MFWQLVRRRAVILGGSSAVSAALLGGAYWLTSFGYFWLRGGSMRPTFEPDEDQVVFVDRLDRFGGDGSGPSVGDVVIATRPDKPWIQICKRVAAVAGDEVSWCEWAPGTVPSGDLETCEGGHRRSLVVAPGTVFLIGDNSASSVDSRNFGVCPVDLVEGRVIAKLLPSFGWVDNNPEMVQKFRPRSPAAAAATSEVLPTLCDADGR